jgi:hypothetical protein
MIIEELDLPKRCPEPPLPTVREERQDLLGEKGLAVRREFAGGEQRAKSAVRELRGRIGIEKQGLVARSEIRLREEIEGALGGLQLVSGRRMCLKLQQSHLEGEPEVHWRGRGNRSQQVVKSLLLAPGTPSIAEIEVVANRLVRKVKMPDPEPTVDDFATHEILVAPVGLGLGHITDWDKVEFPGTAGCVLDNAEFAHRIGSGWVELELI